MMTQATAIFLCVSLICAASYLLLERWERKRDQKEWDKYKENLD
jgi:hypothetical protein